MLVVSAGRKETAGAVSASSAATAAWVNVPRVGVRLARVLVSTLVIGIVLPRDELLDDRRGQIRGRLLPGRGNRRSPPLPHCGSSPAAAIAASNRPAKSESGGPYAGTLLPRADR